MSVTGCEEDAVVSGGYLVGLRIIRCPHTHHRLVVHVEHRDVDHEIDNTAASCEQAGEIAARMTRRVTPGMDVQVLYARCLDRIAA